MRTQKGFTLIELLIVIAIIGILASIVLVSLSGARERAKVASFKSAVRSVQARAVERCDMEVLDYINETGSFGVFPTSIDASNIVDNGQSCGSVGDISFSANIPSADLSTVCTATIQETGVTNFNGC